MVHRKVSKKTHIRGRTRCHYRYFFANEQCAIFFLLVWCRRLGRHSGGRPFRERAMVRTDIWCSVRSMRFKSGLWDATNTPFSFCCFISIFLFPQLTSAAEAVRHLLWITHHPYYGTQKHALVATDIFANQQCALCFFNQTAQEARPCQYSKKGSRSIIDIRHEASVITTY